MLIRARPRAAMEPRATHFAVGRADPSRLRLPGTMFETRNSALRTERVIQVIEATA